MDLDFVELISCFVVGGSSKIPRVHEKLKEFFGKETLNMSLNPDKVVAQGAAIRAAMMIGSEANIDFTNVTPISLGIEIVGNRFSIIVPRNTPVPCARAREYFTVKDYQTSISVIIYEGEDVDCATKNHLLGEFEMEGIPSALARNEPIDVTIDVDIEGILHVTAKVRSTGQSQDIKITRAGLSEEELHYLM
jgi:molecular chaperone DnaK